MTVAFETGQETAELLRRTLDDLAAPNLKVNFDPANMLLYDMGDPIRAVELLAPDIRSVHVKDAKRPTNAGQWGEEVPLGKWADYEESYLDAATIRERVALVAREADGITLETTTETRPGDRTVFATMFVGAPGGLAGTTALEGADATPEPRALLADTVKV